MIKLRVSRQRTTGRIWVRIATIGAVAGATVVLGLGVHSHAPGAFMGFSASASPGTNSAGPPAGTEAMAPRDEDRNNQQALRLHARKSRLEAERARAEEIAFPTGFLAHGPTAELAALGERRFFLAKRAAGQNMKAQLGEKINQLQQDRVSLDAQLEAKTQEVALVREELEFVVDMYERKLVNKVRLIGMQREVVRFKGELVILGAGIEKIEKQIAELKHKIAEVDDLVVLDAERELIILASELSDLDAPSVAARPPAETGLARADRN